MNSFSKDLAAGVSVEISILNKIQSKYPKAVRLEGKIKPYDIYVPETNIYIEIKSDKKSLETGNIVVEVEMFNKPSGLNSTKSDIWIFYTGREYICIKPSRIWECLSRNMLSPVEFVGNGDSQPKKAYLIKKELLKKYAIKGAIKRCR
tara:strand:- start:1232 stop:1675 length:444 start_codon:yes stop_codon:yes gene_type:complete